MGVRIQVLLLVFILMLMPWSPLDPSISSESVNELEKSTQVQSSATLAHWEPGTALIDSSLQNLNSDIVSVIVITDQLLTLHEWQIEHGFLIPQLPSKGSDKLVDVYPTQGILEHRTVNLPGTIVGKLSGVPGVRAVFPDPGMPEPSGFTLDSTPTSVRSGELHGATNVWDNGRNGSGIIVAVADSGIDFAHPDLNGTQARYNNVTSPYHDWPLMHDPMSILLWLRDAKAYPEDDKSWWSDTSDTDQDSNNDSELDGTGFKIGDIPVSMSGVYHIGEHPDSKLVSRAGGDVPVLVVDSTISGVYDTVYVDLDRDGNFSDEIPMTKGNETAGLDLNGDGLWDRSAGLIWWISDGVHGVPYGDIYAARNGYQNRIPGNGDMVLFMINDVNEGGGNHGTLCASAINAQAKVSNGKVLGMAPGSKTTAVANLYSYGSMLDSYRFISEGYDGNSSTDEQPHIGSFSFGYSGTHNDGADPNSMYLDWLTRVHSPTTTYFVATGNGGHGYGTTAAPGGAHGVISVGAFSSKTGESNGGTWGQSTSWSNRGPNSVSRLDPDIVAVGWSATGDRTLNERTNANEAHTTWGGTSLATPIAAGLGALIIEAWKDVHGTYPTSEQVRDIMMSTADDRGYDPLVQGAGWANVSRAVETITGENGTLSVEPASWMTGMFDGAHRDANLNFIRPGENQTMSLTLSNPGSTNISVNLQPQIMVPMQHWTMKWNSTETSPNATWDGYQADTPDILIPIHIDADSNYTLPNATTLIRARAAMDGAGFDGNQNSESENRVYLRLWRWTDRDGDGMFHDDQNDDNFVDSGEWTENSNEFAMLTEHVYASGQVEVRMGMPLQESDDGLLLAVWRENIRANQIDPLPIEIDWTAFGTVNDSWVNVSSNHIIQSNSSSQVNVSINVPNNADPGLRQHGIKMLWNSTTNDTSISEWTWPIITNVAYVGSFDSNPMPLDGNMSNQTLYEETWIQGAQRWGWRAESGDWKMFTIDWPAGYTENGTALIDVDWDDNIYTDIDVHWMSETLHPYSLSNPQAYGSRTMRMESSSANKHSGSGIYTFETNTGSSHEFLTADSTPGVKQVMLHSAMHGVGTNDNPVSIDVGVIAPLDGGFGCTVEDWIFGDRNESVRLGSTMDIEIITAEAVGWSQPTLLSGQTVAQDNPDDHTSASYIHSFSVNDLSEMTISTTSFDIPDLDLYIGRDINGNGVMDWGNEERGSSGQFNSDESVFIDNPQDGLWFVGVHGFNVGNGNGTFKLKIDTVASGTGSNSGLNVQNITEMNASNILNSWPNGSNELNGEIPTSAWILNLSMFRPSDSGIWSGTIDLTLEGGAEIRLKYIYNLIEKSPDLEFTFPDNGTITNTTKHVNLHLIDTDKGFNLTGLNWTQNGVSELTNVTVDVLNLNGSFSNRTTEWYHFIGPDVNLSQQAYSDLLNDTLREVWINGTMSPIEGWHFHDVSILDHGNLWNSTSLAIEYDITLPVIGLSNWRSISNQSFIDDMRLITEPGVEVWINGTPLDIDSAGSALLSLELMPSHWVRTSTGGLNWIDMNRFEIVVRDPAGNWNIKHFQIPYDPYPPGIDGESRDQIILDGMFLTEPFGLHKISKEQMFLGINATRGDIEILVPFDSKSICLSLIEPFGNQVSKNCVTSPNPPPWIGWDAEGWSQDAVDLGLSEQRELGFDVDWSNYSDGLYSIFVEVEDWAGHFGSSTFLMDVDRQAPTIQWIGFNEIVERTEFVLSTSFGEWSNHSIYLNGKMIANGIGSSYTGDILLNRTGEHTVCIDATDRTHSTEYPNIAHDCRQILLDPSKFTPFVDAQWNGSTVSNPLVSFSVSRGWGQNASWVHLASNQSTIQNISLWSSIDHPGGMIPIAVDLELVEGINDIRLMVEAVEKIYFYELTVELDTTPPILEIITPNNGIYSYSNIRFEGLCEPHMEVRIDSSASNASAICGISGNFEMTIELENIDGEHPLVFRSIDDLGNMVRVDQMVTLDFTSPEALLGWYSAQCEPRSASRIIGETPVTSCEIIGEVAVIDNDLKSWKISLLKDGIEITSKVGNSSWNGTAIIEANNPTEGSWTLTVEMEDIAGNNRTLSTSIDIQGREATSSEQFLSFGSTYNILAISVILFTTLISWISIRKTTDDYDSDMEIELTED